jgi:hypothetical protein
MLPVQAQSLPLQTHKVLLAQQVLVAVAVDADIMLQEEPAEVVL